MSSTSGEVCGDDDGRMCKLERSTNPSDVFSAMRRQALERQDVADGLLWNDDVDGESRARGCSPVDGEDETRQHTGPPQEQRNLQVFVQRQETHETGRVGTFGLVIWGG